MREAAELEKLQAPVRAGLEGVGQRLAIIAAAMPEIFRPVAGMLTGGGKRLRPLLLLLSTGEQQKAQDGAVALATAVEAMHVASLIHDDVVDEAEQRRGQASTTAALGRRQAVLAGDYLAAIAYQEVQRARLPAAGEILAAAVVEMTLAEVKAVANASRLFSEAEYMEVIAGKTGALFEAAAHLGALIGGASEDTVERLRIYGRSLGLAFQMRDDLLDLYGDPQQLGKPVRKDLAGGNYTLPIIFAADQPRGAVMRDLLARLREKPEDGDLAEEIADLAQRLGGKAYTEQQMRRYTDQALAAVPDLPTKEHLRDLARYVVGRNS